MPTVIPKSYQSRGKITEATVNIGWFHSGDRKSDQSGMQLVGQTVPLQS